MGKYEDCMLYPEPEDLKEAFKIGFKINEDREDELLAFEDAYGDGGPMLKQVSGNMRSRRHNTYGIQELNYGFRVYVAFSTYRSTIRIDQVAYPHYAVPESFSPYILDGKHLYYINTFESATNAIKTAAVSAQNVARLIFSRCRVVNHYSV